MCKNNDCPTLSPKNITTLVHWIGKPSYRLIWMHRSMGQSEGLVDVLFRRFFLVLHQNVFCGYSLELAHWGNSNEHPQDMFGAKITKIILNYHLSYHVILICWFDSFLFVHRTCVCRQVLVCFAWLTLSLFNKNYHEIKLSRPDSISDFSLTTTSAFPNIQI